MKNLSQHLLMGMVLLAISVSGMAATMNITASFSPSLSNPENNRFINTTPQSGYCASWPSQCTGGKVSISMGGISATLASAGIKANDKPRKSMYFKMPGAKRGVTVTNTTSGQTVTVGFRVNAFSATYHTATSWNLAKFQNAWNGSSFIYAPAPCSYSGLAYLSSRWYEFMWNWPASDSACYKTAKQDLIGEPTLINEISIGYELTTPNPLRMASGVYTGSLPLSVGPGGDIDFGDNYRASDTELTLNFTLSVNHELKVTPTADEQSVSLQPCGLGRTCTEDEGDANWERWMITRITPQLTGRSHFDLSSSGAFTVYLECEQQSGSDCAVKSDNTPSQTVPVQTLLTLPDNVVDSLTGATVSKRRLEVGKVLTKNIFTTKVFGQNKAGSIDFLVLQKDVDTMLKTRPDTYRGAVTVIFDPNLY